MSRGVAYFGSDAVMLLTCGRRCDCGLGWGWGGTLVVASLLLVVWPGAPSSILSSDIAPSSMARTPSSILAPSSTLERNIEYHKELSSSTVLLHKLQHANIRFQAKQ